MSSGRVLLVGEGLTSLGKRLTARGLELQNASVSELKNLSDFALPDAIVLAKASSGVVQQLRRHAGFREVPIVLDGRRSRTRVTAPGVDGVGGSLAELESLAVASVTARRALAAESVRRQRLEALLRATRAGAEGAGLARVLTALRGQLPALLGTSGLTVLTRDAAGRYSVTDGVTVTPVELAVAAGFRSALEARAPVSLEGVEYVPLPEGPVACLAVQRDLPLTSEELEFVREAGSALAVAWAREHAGDSSSEKQASLEAAYVERFRELNAANTRLKALDRKKNEIVAMLSHDLRAPLNVLTGHAYLIETDDAFPRALMPSIKAIQDTTRKILGLVESLLDGNRGDNEKLLLFSRTMDVAETVIEVVRDLQILARQKGITLKAEAPMSLPVQGDEVKIRQALQNLITNSIQHAANATQISVRARLKPRPDGDVAQVEVRDNGTLVDPNSILLAFERSKGLGLSIARDLIDRHGGEIWAEAPATGGAMFAFNLPMRSEPSKLARTPGAELPVVVVADSDPVAARTIQLGLSGHYRVEVVRQGSEVVSRIEALRPALLLLDLFLEQKDGLQVLRELQASAPLKSLPVIVTTTNAGAAAQLTSAEIGSADLLMKPFQVGELLHRIEVALRVPSQGLDPQTGLLDQLGFARQLDAEFDRSVVRGRALTLVLLRPRGPVTDLMAMARLIKAQLRQHDVVAHLGQGIFAVMLPESSETALSLQGYDTRVEVVSNVEKTAAQRFENLLLGRGA